MGGCLFQIYVVIMIMDGWVGGTSCATIVVIMIMGGGCGGAVISTFLAPFWASKNNFFSDLTPIMSWDNSVL